MERVQYCSQRKTPMFILIHEFVTIWYPILTWWSRAWHWPNTLLALSARKSSQFLLSYLLWVSFVLLKTSLQMLASIILDTSTYTSPRWCALFETIKIWHPYSECHCLMGSMEIPKNWLKKNPLRRQHRPTYPPAFLNSHFFGVTVTMSAPNEPQFLPIQLGNCP